MKLGKQILKVLGQTYAADAMIEKRVGRHVLVFKTDDFGRPVLLFIGKHGAHDRIHGERFTRHLVIDASGQIVKDHWDNKEKT